MELAVVDRWTDAEVFLDLSSRRLMTFKDHSLFVVDIDSRTRTHFQLPEVTSLRTVALSPGSHVLAFVQDSTRLDCVLLEGTEHFTYSPGRYRNIVGFEWVSSSSCCDLVLVTNADIQVLRLNERKNKLIYQKSFACPASRFWSHDGVLVVAAPPPKLGFLSVFYLSANKGTKTLSGPRFKLDLEPAVSDGWASSYNGKIQSREIVPHRVLLCRLYEGHYFVHMNCRKGEGHLYALSESSVSMHTSMLCSEPGDYELSCFDNLLLFTNVSASETYVFDIRSESYEGVPFCTIVHRNPPERPLNLSIVSQFDGSIDFSFNFDSPKSTFVTIPKDAHIIYSELPEDSLQFVSQDLGISAQTCYKLDIEADRIVRSHPDRLEASLFLLRRTGYKVKSYEYIRLAIREKVSLIDFSHFFESINIAYKIAAIERKNIRPRSENSDLKLVTGMTVLLQSDMHNFVFIPMFEDKSVENGFLSAVMTEYLRSLGEHEIPVHMSLQILLARVLVRGKDFIALHQLIQYHVFSDSAELAQILLVLSQSASLTHYPPALQLGIDMLTRLGAIEDVAFALVERNLLFEAMNYHTPAFTKTSQRMAEETAKLEDVELREVLTSYLNECSY